MITHKTGLEFILSTVHVHQVLLRSHQYFVVNNYSLLLQFVWILYTDVCSHRFVCQGTVEEQIVRLQEKKLKLSHEVLSG